jgi:hypothetical protein
MLRCRSLLRGVPWVGSPASLLVLRHSDASPTLLRSAFALLGSSVPFRIGGGEASQVPGRPLCACPAPLTPPSRRSRPPGQVPALWRRRCCLPRRQPRRPRNHKLSGLTTRPAHPLSTLHDRGRPLAAQDSLPAGGPHLGRSGLSPAGRCVRFLLATSLPPHPGLAWRTVDFWSSGGESGIGAGQSH